MALPVARLSRRAKSGCITHEGRPARHARMALRFRRVTLPAPRGSSEEEPVKVSATHLCEISPPEGVRRIEWYLLTTMAVTTPEEAKQMVEHYTLRWRVEKGVLKSGCRVEKLRVQQAASLHKAITLHMVTAWRLMLITLLGRVSADMEAEVIFTDTELHRMRVYARNYGLAKHTDLASAVMLVAIMGGYMIRRRVTPSCGAATPVWRYAAQPMRSWHPMAW